MMRATGGQVCHKHMLGFLMAFSRTAKQLSISYVLPRGSQMTLGPQIRQDAD